MRSHEFLVIFTVFCSNLLQSEGYFGYTRPEQHRWPRKYHECGGKYQSPISIFSSKAIPIPLPAMEMVGYHNLLPGPLLMHNNGHSVSLNIPKPPAGESRLPYIFGGKLADEYELEGLHFHWADQNSRGSEHVLNGIRFPIEMHIIHRNRRYETMAEALKHEDGLCVLAFFYQLKEIESPQLTHIVHALDFIEDYNDSIMLNSTFALSALLGHVDTDRFYTYRGSLTTPPCSEAVRWVLFPDTLDISVGQIAKFRHLSSNADGFALVNNYRHLQPLRNRRVFVRKINIRNTKLNAVQSQAHYTDWDWLY